MIDSVLKGTGNSRFLKSAVPAGTSWADALAMLQAGTFPIDFNGINTEGFQQVGTPLNKANLLKDATALTLGLTGDVVPNDMFNALAHAGDLHVWKKTVVTTDPIPEQPAGYNLGSKTNFLIGTPSRSSQEPYINVMYANTVSVSNDGTVNISGDSSSISGWYPSNGDSPNYLQMRGKFIKITQFMYLDAPRTVDMDTVYYIPNDAIATLPNYGSAYGEFRIEMQKVTGYPYTPEIPAGTTVTYPVSTNRNAYQEGNDAKPAGYVVGDATSMKIISYAGGSGYYVRFYTADSVSVLDSGALSIVEDNNSASLISKSSDGNELRGKYIKYHSSYQASTEIVSGMIYFVPSNAVFTWSNGMLICDKVQLVTGYPAIPAGTTIEYLGKLGDKARVQVVSYVGTGTYGIDNPTNITADFKMKFLLIYDFGGSSSAPGTKDSAPRAYAVEELKTEYTNYWGYVFQGGSYAKRSADGKTVSFYGWSTDSQGNNSGYRYFAIAIG